MAKKKDSTANSGEENLDIYVPSKLMQKVDSHSPKTDVEIEDKMTSSIQLSEVKKEDDDKGDDDTEQLIKSDATNHEYNETVVVNEDAEENEENEDDDAEKEKEKDDYVKVESA